MFLKESITKLSLGSSEPESHINVKITGPDGEETEEKSKTEASYEFLIGTG